MGTYTKAPRLGRNRQGRYEIRWTENRRSRSRSTGTSDYGQAQQVLADFLNQRQAQEAARHDPTVAQALDAYLEGHIRPHAEDAARGEVMARWLREALGERKVSSLQPRDGRSYAKRRRTGSVGKRRAGDGTIRLELGMLQAALRYVAEEYRLDDVPRLARPEAPAPADHWLTQNQVSVMLDWFAERERDERMSRTHRFIVLALATAARKRAIETLRWEHVDRTRGTVRYDRQVQVQTRKRRVAVPIAAWLEPYLDRMVDERETSLVLDHDGDIRSAFSYAMKHLAADSGDADYLSLTRHALRHTAATLALHAGATIWQVAGMLGDTPATVTATYGHHAPDSVRGAVDSWRASP